VKVVVIAGVLKFACPAWPVLVVTAAVLAAVAVTVAIVVTCADMPEPAEALMDVGVPLASTIALLIKSSRRTGRRAAVEKAKELEPVKGVLLLGPKALQSSERKDEG